MIVNILASSKPLCNWDRLAYIWATHIWLCLVRFGYKKYFMALTNTSSTGAHCECSQQSHDQYTHCTLLYSHNMHDVWQLHSDWHKNKNHTCKLPVVTLHTWKDAAARKWLKAWDARRSGWRAILFRNLSNASWRVRMNSSSNRPEHNTRQYSGLHQLNVQFLGCTENFSCFMSCMEWERGKRPRGEDETWERRGDSEGEDWNQKWPFQTSTRILLNN